MTTSGLDHLVVSLQHLVAGLQTRVAYLERHLRKPIMNIEVRCLADAELVKEQIQAAQTQAYVVHVVAGSDEWMPTHDELRELAQVFITAFEDPNGAVLVTRPGVTATLISHAEPEDKE